MKKRRKELLAPRRQGAKEEEGFEQKGAKEAKG
jgi:hypothetical protein